MKTRVTLEDQPLDFIRRQPPDARRAMREVLHSIEAGHNFPEPLQDQLDGFYKVKVSGYRLIRQAVSGESGPHFRVVFAEKRNVVYALFARLLGLE